MDSAGVIAGLGRLDPAIRLFEKKVDARVKPARDDRDNPNSLLNFRE